MNHPGIYVKNRQDSHDFGGREARSDSSLENGRGEVRDGLFVRGGLGVSCPDGRSSKEMSPRLKA
jgi:hypothetical protein